MEKKKFESKSEGIIRNLFMALVFIIGPIVFLLFTTLNWFENSGSAYCLGSKNRFEFCYEIEIDYEPISDIFLDNLTFITVGDKTTGDIFFTCATESENSPNFKVQDIKLGDTIFKKMNTNRFSVIRKEVEYVFIIDVTYEKSK